MASSGITPEKIRDALATVKYPGFTRDIVSFGLLKGVSLEAEPYGILLEVTTQDQNLIAQITQGASQALAPLGAKFEIRVTQKNAAQAQPATALAQGIDGVKHIVAVASGKGGVGKSTVAANLAAALRKMNLKVGLLDCDIYGPSMGLMFGTAERPYANEDQTIEPVVQLGIRLMSMGFLMEDNTPAILRGPIVTRYTQQLLKQTRWGELDILVLDLPPGTGDIQLTIVQTVALSGAVIVTPRRTSPCSTRKKGWQCSKKPMCPFSGSWRI
ncbi:P-loop NTPase [Kamptonema cortianum]|nr:P-loop NTPase [Kamptonema cortianum]MDL5046010.1 P-loop NTPase [Oscillatoria amoena NRMC-F 0135]